MRCPSRPVPHHAPRARRVVAPPTHAQRTSTIRITGNYPPALRMADIDRVPVRSALGSMGTVSGPTGPPHQVSIFIPDPTRIARHARSTSTSTSNSNARSSRIAAHRAPCPHAFIRLRAFPSAVLGPVLRSQGFTLAAEARRVATPPPRGGRSVGLPCRSRQRHRGSGPRCLDRGAWSSSYPFPPKGLRDGVDGWRTDTLGHLGVENGGSVGVGGGSARARRARFTQPSPDPDGRVRFEVRLIARPTAGSQRPRRSPR